MTKGEETGGIQIKSGNGQRITTINPEKLSNHIINPTILNANYAVISNGKPVCIDTVKTVGTIGSLNSNWSVHIKYKVTMNASESSSYAMSYTYNYIEEEFGAFMASTYNVGEQVLPCTFNTTFGKVPMVTLGVFYGDVTSSAISRGPLSITTVSTNNFTLDSVSKL